MLFIFDEAAILLSGMEHLGVVDNTFSSIFPFGVAITLRAQAILIVVRYRFYVFSGLLVIYASCLFSAAS
jgi:hypothetical protein